MIEILMLLGGIAIWFVLGILSVAIAMVMAEDNLGLKKYKFLNKTGRKRSKLSIILRITLLGPFTGAIIYCVIRAVIEMHQGKIYLEEV